MTSTGTDLLVGNKYRVSRKIGGGSFGDIFLGECATFILVHIRYSLVVLPRCSRNWPSSAVSGQIQGFNTRYWAGVHIDRGEEVAIKLESVRCKHPQLLYESKVIRYLKGGSGLPEVKWYGVEGDYNIMVIDLLGPSLEGLTVCNQCFQDTNVSFNCQ